MITTASRAQLWLTILSCLTARWALPDATVDSMARAAAALTVGLFFQRVLTGERFYWAGETPKTDAGAKEQIFIFGDLMETEVEAARERNYLRTASSSRRSLLLIVGVATVLFVTYGTTRMAVSQLHFGIADFALILCALSFLPAMTPRHFLAPTFVASMSVLLHWVFAPQSAGALHLLTFFLTASCLVAHEWITAERSAANARPLLDPTLFAGLLRESAHIIVPLLTIGTLCSMIFPKSPDRPRLAERTIQQAAKLITPSKASTSEAIELAQKVGGSNGKMPSAGDLQKAKELAQNMSLPATDLQYLQSTLQQAKEADLGDLKRISDESAGRPLTPEEREQAMALMKQLESLDPKALEEFKKESTALESKLKNDADVKELEALARGSLERELTVEESKRGRALLEKMGASLPQRPEDYEKLRDHLKKWAGDKPNLAVSPEDAKGTAGRPSATRDHPSARPNPLPSFSAIDSKALAQSGVVQSGRSAAQKADIKSDPRPHPEPTAPRLSTPPELPKPDAAAAERLIRALIFAALAFGVILFLSRVGKRMSRSAQAAKDARKRKRALVREIHRLDRARLPLHEEIEQRYLLFLEIAEAAGEGREDWFPETDYSRRMQKIHPPLAKEVETLTETFCDWRFGTRLPAAEGVTRFRASFSRIAEWYGRSA